ncbi:MAG: glycogen debranching N-terminal domain-containing protein [Dehalococcoidia bacterium]
MAILEDSISVASGSSFVVSNRLGDIEEHGTRGFFVSDTRFLSRFRVLIQGRPGLPVGASQIDHASANFFATTAQTNNRPTNAVSLVRDRYVAGGMHEDISVMNHSRRRLRIRITIEADADFADLFEVRTGRFRKRETISVGGRADADLSFTYERADFHRATLISFSEHPAVSGNRATFDLDLEPKQEWRTCVTVIPVADQALKAPKCKQQELGSPFGPYRPARAPRRSRSLDDGAIVDFPEMPQLEGDELGLELTYPAAVRDLHSLTMAHKSGVKILAAGLPWFMAVFGRDAIISAIQTKLLGADFMRGALATLAELQATEIDEFREAQPGKIPHEVRLGELSATGEVPHSRYYGSVDATPLFVRLLWETYQWTGDRSLLDRYLQAAEAAISWIDRYGDLDCDGFVEYKRSTPRGLLNQGWKDSVDAVSFANGRLAQGPIALAEVQGYVFNAKLCMAEIYRVLDRSEDAARLSDEAEVLQKRFNEAFWMPADDCFAMALDGKKRQVDSISSNAGQCLWTGIVDSDRAGALIERMMAPDMFNGWGIRTLSSEMARYNPLSYHNGTVWPHDNSLIASGMQRYGYGQQALQVSAAILDTAQRLPRNRPPELIAGFPRRRDSPPVPYPMANSPQAWASGAIIYSLETMMGISVVDGTLQMSGGFEKEMRLHLRGVPFRGMRLNV